MIKEMFCKSNDKRIYGLLYIPDNDEEKYPFVILSHGLSLDHSIMKAYAEKLLKYNIASYVFDFCGGGFNSKSDGEISQMSIKTEMNDLNNVIDMVLNLDCVDKKRVYLAGHSQGGLVSSLVAPSRINDINALFLFAPAYEIPDDVVEEELSESNVLNLMPDDLGEFYINDAKDLDVYNRISGYTKDVFIFHGKLDARVDISYSIKADDVYQNCTLIVYDDEPHRFSDECKDDVVKHINDFIKNN